MGYLPNGRLISDLANLRWSRSVVDARASRSEKGIINRYHYIGWLVCHLLGFCFAQFLEIRWKPLIHLKSPFEVLPQSLGEKSKAVYGRTSCTTFMAGAPSGHSYRWAVLPGRQH